MPPFLFFLGVFFGVESWAAAHGLYRCTEYRLLSEPMSTRLLNSISSRICRQNTQFNMYTTTSKQQEGCTFKDSHPKCFVTTNFDKFHPEAFARGGESRWCFDSMFPNLVPRLFYLRPALRQRPWQKLVTWPVDNLMPEGVRVKYHITCFHL